MRWDSLFADLSAQLEAEERLTFEVDVADLTRAELAAISLTDRLRAHVDRDLRFRLADGSALQGRPTEVGADWVLLAGSAGGTLIPIGALTSVSGLSRAAEPEAGLGARLSLQVVLRGLARDRAHVTVWTVGGPPVTGTVDRVGSDHLDLAMHPPDQPRLPRAVTEVRSVRLQALLRVTAR